MLHCRFISQTCSNLSNEPDLIKSCTHFRENKSKEKKKGKCETSCTETFVIHGFPCRLYNQTYEDHENMKNLHISSRKVHVIIYSHLKKIYNIFTTFTKLLCDGFNRPLWGSEELSVCDIREVMSAWCICMYWWMNWSISSGMLLTVWRWGWAVTGRWHKVIGCSRLG